MEDSQESENMEEFESEPSNAVNCLDMKMAVSAKENSEFPSEGEDDSDIEMNETDDQSQDLEEGECSNNNASKNQRVIDYNQDDEDEVQFRRSAKRSSYYDDSDQDISSEEQRFMERFAWFLDNRDKMRQDRTTQGGGDWEFEPNNKRRRSGQRQGKTNQETNLMDCNSSEVTLYRPAFKLLNAPAVSSQIQVGVSTIPMPNL